MECGVGLASLPHFSPTFPYCKRRKAGGSLGMRLVWDGIYFQFGISYQFSCVFLPPGILDQSMPSTPSLEKWQIQTLSGLRVYTDMTQFGIRFSLLHNVTLMWEQSCLCAIE